MSTQWNFSHDGRYCHGFGVDTVTANPVCEVVAASESYTREGVNAGDIYWEPTAGTEQDSPALWATGLVIQANMSAKWETRNGHNVRTNGGEFTTPFIVRTRTLGPPAQGQPALEGPDVQMLENMLWALGLSPQRGGDYRDDSMAGSEGARINSSRNKSGLGNWTHDCNNQSIEHRNRYYSGWGVDCARGQVSLEGMVRRFRARNEVDVDTTSRDPETRRRINNDHLYAGMEASGEVDDALLGYLGTIWTEYHQAYDARYQIEDEDGDTETFYFRDLERVGFNSTHMNDWIAQMLTVWESGDEAAGLVPTYTGVSHAEVLAALGMENNADDENGITRADLFRAWKSQEAPYHWGTNEKSYQPTDFRVVEGGGDEAGSMGFSQIKYAYRYGHADLRCAALEAYNLYHPIDSLKGMIAFVSSPPAAANVNCTGSFHHGFAATGRWVGMSRERGSLRGYRNPEGNVVPIVGDRIDDAYERLMKSLAGYNGMTHLNAFLWPQVLKEAHTTRMGVAASNRRYAMQIRDRLGLEGRTYIWRGGQHPPGHPQAGEDWCFAYGEQEWMNPEDHPLTGDPLRFDGYQALALLNEDRRVNCE